MLKRYLGAAVGCALLLGTTIAYAAGMFPGLPIVGGASYCQGTSVYSTSVTTPGTLATPNNCTVTVPAGPATLTGAETIPMDTLAPNGVSPQTVALPSSLIAGGFGGTTVATTTGTTAAVVVADAISTYIYAGAGTATYTSFKLPPNPIQNQKLCLVDAGTGVLTLTAVVVGTTGQLIVGTAPTSIPVQTAVGTAGTVTLGTNCWLYNVSNTTWYRVL